MEWHLAGYGEHPVDGDAGRVASLAAHLTTVSTDIRAQVGRMRALNSGDFWESSAGSAEAFQEVIEDLPEKLDLVATRYETVTGALDLFHPVLADAKQDAEYWIEQAAAAQEEIERAESGIELIEQFEEQAERDAEAANEDGEPGDTEVEPDQWEGEDYHATLEAAQADLNNAVEKVQSAVDGFKEAARNCADAIHDAGDDDLENEGGLFSGIGDFFSGALDALSNLPDALLDVLEVVVDVLEVIAIGIGIAILVIAIVATGGLAAVPVGLVVASVVVSGAVFAGTAVLYANDRADGWDLAIAGLGFATAGLGAFSGPVGAFFTGFGGGLAGFGAGIELGELITGQDPTTNAIVDGLESGAAAIDSLDIDPAEIWGPILLPDPVAVPPAPGGLWSGLSSSAGLEAAFEPAQTLQTIDPGLISAVTPDGVDVPDVDVTTPMAGTLPQTTQVATVPVPAGVG